MALAWALAAGALLGSRLPSAHLASAASDPEGSRRVSRWRAALGRIWANWGPAGKGSPFLGSIQQGSPSVLVSSFVWQHLRSPAHFWWQTVVAQQCQALAQLCGTHSRVTPEPQRSPRTLCRCLRSLCCSSCWVLARISATWRWWASSSSGSHGSPRGGLGSPWGTGAAMAVVAELTRRGETPHYAAGEWGWWGLTLSAGRLAAGPRSSARSRGVRTSPRGAPRARPGPSRPREDRGSPESRSRGRRLGRSSCWDIVTLKRQMGWEGRKLLNNKRTG